MTTIERARVKLRPTTRQREMLDTLFAGPTLVADVLRSEPNSVRTPEDASFLLFRHRALLESYLSSQSRGEAVDLLKLLVLEWSTDPPEEFELSFPEDCSLSSAQQVYLPLPSLGLLEVADADRLRQLRAGNRYTPSFGLLRSGKDLSVTLTFWRYSAPERVGLARGRSAASQDSKPKNRASLSITNFLAMFDNRVNAALMHELRVSRQFSTVRFSDLTGRAVQGGLPSLGKRR